MNDKPASAPALKSPLRLNRETLKHLSARTGLRTGASGNDTVTVGCDVTGNPPPTKVASYNACAQSGVCYAGGGLGGSAKAG